MNGLMSIRIPGELQVKMKKYDINWSDKVRTYLETQIKQLELSKFLKQNASKMKHAKMHADSTAMIRVDRDSR
jgi:post-segregation antitoxin (ccd killing protein)